MHIPVKKIPKHNKIFPGKKKKKQDSLVDTVHRLLKLNHGSLVPLQNDAFHLRVILQLGNLAQTIDHA
jgi:hypothetical protein